MSSGEAEVAFANNFGTLAFLGCVPDDARHCDRDGLCGFGGTFAAGRMVGDDHDQPDGRWLAKPYTGVEFESDIRFTLPDQPCQAVQVRNVVLKLRALILRRVRIKRSLEPLIPTLC
jgi:hypothetical protein